MTNEEKLDLLLKAVRDIHIFTTPVDGATAVQDEIYAVMKEAKVASPGYLPIDGLVEDVVQDFAQYLIEEGAVTEVTFRMHVETYLATRGKEDVIPKEKP